MKLGSFFLNVIVLILCFSTNVLLNAAVITTITPAVSPSSGGIVVTIAGSGFTGTTAVDFGNKPAAGFIVNSDNIITAITPAHSPQVVAVIVTAPSGVSPITSNSFFTFQGEWQVYVNNLASDNVSVINAGSDTIVATPTVGDNPSAIAITPDGTKAYITNFNDSNVSVIDTATNTVIATIPVGAFPIALAITPDGSKVYVANPSSGDVSVIETTSDTVIATIPTGSPGAIMITPDGTRAYIVNLISNNVSVIDTSTNTVIATIPVGIVPIALAITPDATKVYVINSNSDNVSVIDTATNTVIATVPVGTAPTSLAITSDGTKVYIVNLISNNVSVIDTATNTVIATVPVGPSPRSIIITPNGTKAYVINDNTNDVSVIDTTTNTVIATIPVGLAPLFMAITPDGAKIYVANTGDDTVSIISTVSDSVLLTLPVGDSPTSIAITPDQAPLAKFTFNLGLAGFPSTFDASASVSPVGTIVNYFWDFGDGTTLNTTFATTSHTYVAPGSYLVTLTVTNSAGTSTTQIFNPSFSAFSIMTNSSAITNNGGITAITSQLVTILPFVPPVVILPPRDLQARQVKNIFATQTDFINVLTWKAPVAGSPPVSYEIFRNAGLTKLAARISANDTLRFKDHNRKKGRTYTYFVVSIDQNGNRSVPAVVVIKGKR